MQKLRGRISSLFSTVVCYLAPEQGESQRHCGKIAVFHIVGCNHGIQVGTGGFAALDGVAANEQREHFRAMLSSICEQSGIDSVFEEDGGPEETAGKQLADQLGIPWSDVNTSNDDKQEMGIPQNYVEGDYPAEMKNKWNRQREVFMGSKIKAQRGNVKTSLVICGFDHLDALADLLGQDGTPVHRYDYRNLPWYQDGIFT